MRLEALSRFSFNNKVQDVFHSKDCNGNHVLRLSRIGLCTSLRYVYHDNLYYFNVDDILLSFNEEPDKYSSAYVWSRIPNYVKDELCKYAIEHDFHDSEIVSPCSSEYTANALKRMALSYRETIKLIMNLPADFSTNSTNLDMFMTYYETYFSFIRRMEKATAWYSLDRNAMFMIFTAFLLGVILSILVMFLCNLLRV